MSDFFSLKWDESAPQLTISVNNDYSTECLLVDLNCTETIQHTLANIVITSNGEHVPHNYVYGDNKITITVEKSVIDCSDLTIAGYLTDIAGNDSNTINETISIVCRSSLFESKIEDSGSIHNTSIIDKTGRGDRHDHDYYTQTSN